MVGRTRFTHSGARKRGIFGTVGARGTSQPLVRVAYLDKPPTVRTSHADQPRTTARRILSHKQYNWSYEREWRVLAASIGRISYEPDQPLKTIYLGARISAA